MQHKPHHETYSKPLVRLPNLLHNQQSKIAIAPIATPITLTFSFSSIIRFVNSCRPRPQSRPRILSPCPRVAFAHTLRLMVEMRISLKFCVHADAHFGVCFVVLLTVIPGMYCAGALHRAIAVPGSCCSTYLLECSVSFLFVLHSGKQENGAEAYRQ